MPETPLRRRLPMGRLGFYLVCGMLVGGMWLVNRNISDSPYAVDQSQLSAESLMSKSVDVYQSMNSLLITLATGLLGAMGYLFVNGPKRRYRLAETWPAILSAVFVALSLFFAYLSYYGLEFSLINSVSLESNMTQEPKSLQFTTLLLAVIFFADFVVQDLGKAD